MKHFLHALTKKIIYLCAFIIIIVAFGMAAAKLMSPVLNKHRNEFAQLISQKINAPVSIERVSMGWYEYYPEIRLENVAIIDKPTQQVALKIDRINVFISLWKSLWQRKAVISGLMVKGTSLNITQNAQQEVIVQGLPPMPSAATVDTSPRAKFMDVMNFLSSQERLILKDIDIRYKGFNQDIRHVTVYQLSFFNGKINHRIVGEAVLHQDVPTEINFASKWQGPVFDPTSINAKGYFYISGLNLAQWWNNYTVDNWQIQKGIVSSKVWFEWKHNKFQKIQTVTRAYNVDAYSLKNKSHHRVARLSGNFGWKREDNRFVVAGDDILLDLPNHLWPVTSFYVTLEPNAQGTYVPKMINVGYLDIGDVLNLLPASNITLSQATQDMLNALKLQGHVENTMISLPDEQWENIALNTKFSHISFNAWQKIPSLQNVSGALQWDGSKGKLTLDSRHTQFIDKQIFPDPLVLKNLSGEIDVVKNAQEWVFSPNVQINNHDLDAHLLGGLIIQADGTPVANLSMNFSVNSVKSFSDYLPTALFSGGLTKWLQQAFLGGEITDGQAILKGELTQFPFADNGTFLISAKLKQVQLRYAPDWPSISDINGDITFNNQQMKVNVADASTKDLALKNVTAEIEQLGTPNLVINGQVIGDLPRALNFINRSPLASSVGAMFKGMQFKGPLALKLGLNVPLSEPGDTKVNGALQLQDTSMDMKQWGLKLTDLNGLVNFTEKSTSAKNIEGLFFNKPVQIKLATKKGINNASITQIVFTNHIAIADLQNWLKVPFDNYATGATNVKGKITFAPDIPIEIHLKSDLKGVALKLPDQYAKSADEARPFATDIFIQDKQPLKMKLFYNRLASVALLLGKKEQDAFSLLGASVNLGNNASAAWPATDGLYVTANFDKLNLDQLKALSAGSGESKLPDMKLKEVTLNANAFDIYGQTLNQVKLNVVPTDKNYNLNLNSKEVVGQVQVPKKFDANELITVQLQHLNIKPTPEKNEKEKPESSVINYDISSLPSIVFNANDVVYDDKQLGQVSFNTQASAKGLTIQSLRVLSPTGILQGSGDWIQTKDGSVTYLSGDMKSKRVSDLIKAFGGQSNNFVATNGTLNFNLRWNNAPYAPEFASLDGTASIDLGKGRIVDVGKSTNAKMDFGRVLSIFSLQSLPRRLTFDFSDLSQKGYSFDYIRGDFKFEDGTANTDNLRFDGPVAGIKINGWIDFKNRNLNLSMNVTPYVTSSIPVAATLITANPLIGLAALAVNTVVTKVTVYTYHVTGPLTNPNWEGNKHTEDKSAPKPQQSAQVVGKSTQVTTSSTPSTN